MFTLPNQKPPSRGSERERCVLILSSFARFHSDLFSLIHFSCYCHKQQDSQGNSKEIVSLYYARSFYIDMGFLDKLSGKKENQPVKEETQKEQSSGQQQGKRIKKYTSDGKPIYE